MFVFAGQLFALALANPLCLCGAVATEGHAPEAVDCHHGVDPCEDGERHECERSHSGTRDVGPAKIAVPPTPESRLLDPGTILTPPLSESLTESVSTSERPPDDWLRSPNRSGVFRL